MLRFTLSGNRAPRARATAAVGVCAVVALAATACSSSASAGAASASAGQSGPAPSSTSSTASQSPRGSVVSGSIQITDAYLPQPASPDVAAAYFIVANNGDQPDELVSATSVPAAQVAMMREISSGGAETMTPLGKALTVPAHGRVALVPGAYHLMLTNPVAAIKQGGTVMLVLRFEHAGTVTLKVPVTSLFSAVLTGPAAGSSTAGMSTAGMPGM